MIRMVQSMSAAHAKTYYKEALNKADYYLDGQELNGSFQGRLSKRLGITGAVTQESFFALCDNKHPDTGNPLTPRTKKERTVGYDINFHVPKSVSILHVLSKDNHVLDAFLHCVAATMQDMEALARVRVRKGGISTDRQTGELLWVDFVHQTARPVDGFVPDPHLHAHCYVFNMTFDEQEQQIKACQFREINKELPYYQALFHKRMADSLVNLGYQVRATAKSFEVVGVPQQVIDLFSKRTDAIGRIAKEKGITDAKQLDELGARTRAKKQQGLSMAELQAEWRAQIRLQETVAEIAKENQETVPIRFAPVKEQAVSSLSNLSAAQCKEYALSHCFERASVVPFNKLAATAFKRSIGSTVSPEAILKELEGHSELITIQEGNRTLCTTQEVLKEEQQMVQLARAGKNAFAPLYDHPPDIKANGQQGDAIRHVLTTSDMVSIVRGAAGAGKTTLMTEAVRHMEQAGKQVTVVAPTAKASRDVLRKEGFAHAETVATLLNSPKMQDELQGQVLWVDEAGMLGTKDMAALLELATKQNARLILGGDTRQHASVVRGDALRILNTVGGIKTAEVDKIYRQKEVVYRNAVADLSKGNISDGFQKLDAIGAVKEVDADKPFEGLISDYMAAVKAGKEILVISPTHSTGEQLTKEIRERLKEAGYIGKRAIEADKLKNMNLTVAQKTDSSNLQQGLVVQFHQNQKGGIKRGSRWMIEQVDSNEVSIKDSSGNLLSLDLTKPEQFDVYKKSQMAVAKGDKIQVTKNSFDKHKNRMDNGMVLDVLSVSKRNGIKLQNASSKSVYEIKADFGNINHAHCITSHASQGKTVDEIFVAQPAATFPATNAKQFYVSVSRAREKVHIYTDDKEELLIKASEVGDRGSAMELVKSNRHLEHVMMLEREKEITPDIKQLPAPEIALDLTIDNNNQYEDYEPGL